MFVNGLDVDCARKEGAASYILEPIATTIRGDDPPEQTLEFTAGRKHDAFKTSQLNWPRELRQTSMSSNRERCTGKAHLYASSVSLEGVDDGHLCLEKWGEKNKECW